MLHSEQAGMPIPGAGTYGDLNIIFDINFPKKLDEEEKELLSSVLDSEEIAKIEQVHTPNPKPQTPNPTPNWEMRLRV